jgi:sarcosine oxidase, subunit gamma
MLDRSQILARFRAQSWVPEGPGIDSVPRLEGRAFPSQVGATSRGSVRVLCLAPGDWLIVSREHTASGLRQRLEPDLAGQGLALVDVTDAFATIEVHGPAARELLAKGCGLDVHRHSFVTGRCARTRFAQTPALIECIDDSPRFELSVARSYFDYLYSWLKDAAVEFEERRT